MKDGEQLAKEAIELLKAISEEDVEIGHARADAILCNLLTELGYLDVVVEFEKIQKWYT